ncbi:hypothetical protein FBQ81_03395 [Chloroflexi bacterium CFX6]|nr:hypothetical protein [Chloroflexi bacterium CFX6]
MIPRTNEKVKTPFGEGICQGRYVETDFADVLVRITITEENAHLLGSTKCLTPNANVSALFVFAESEVENVQ